MRKQFHQINNQPRKSIRTAVIDAELIIREVLHNIQEQIVSALSHYPELADTHSRFKFTRSLRGSIMAARPVIASLFGERKNRKYEMLISAVFNLSDSIEPIHQVEDDVVIGWIGHELGHITDYEQRSVMTIARFGLLYGLSKRYIRKAEQLVDTFAVQRGMAPYLLATKNFILTHSGLSQKYKNKIASLYLSPDDIVALVEELNHSDKEEKRSVIAEEEVIGNEINKDNVKFKLGSLLYLCQANIGDILFYRFTVYSEMSGSQGLS